MEPAVGTDYFIGVAQQAMWVLALASAPILIPALVAGLILGMVQAATSINEQTLGLHPQAADRRDLHRAVRRRDHDIARRLHAATCSTASPTCCTDHAGHLMLPGGLVAIEANLWIFLVAMIRPGAAFLAAPVFSAQNVPIQVRLIISLAVGIPALSQTPFELPPGGIATISGVVLVAGEVIAGLALGFAVQLGFSAAMMAGEVIANSMGLGFAQMVDPQSARQHPR